MTGAIYAMDQRAVLAAVGGDESQLAALRSEEALGEATRGAAAAGFLEPLRALLARGAPVESAIYGRTPLMLACQGGHERCARALLEKGANEVEENEGLHRAHGLVPGRSLTSCAPAHCSRRARQGGGAGGWLHRAHALLPEWPAMRPRTAREGGGDRHGRRRGLHRPHALSCLNGREQCARALIEKGADMEKPDNQGFTPLMSCCQKGHEPCACALLEKGASLKGTGRTTSRC